MHRQSLLKWQTGNGPIADRDGDFKADDLGP
jgi:hypothetical protein